MMRSSLGIMCFVVKQQSCLFRKGASSPNKSSRPVLLKVPGCSLKFETSRLFVNSLIFQSYPAHPII